MRYYSPLIVGTFVAALASAPRPAAAQIRAAGDTDPLGRVPAKVVAGMTQPGALSRPISNLRIVVTGENGDTLSIRTDDAGIATAWVGPGTYRFVTGDPVTWQGRAYRWDITLPIAPGTGAIRLSQGTAIPIAPSPVGAPPQVTGVVPDPMRGPTPTGGTARFRVFADCQVDGCDFDYFRTEIPFVDYVRNRQDASIHILVTAEGTGVEELPTL